MLEHGSTRVKRERELISIDRSLSSLLVVDGHESEIDGWRKRKEERRGRFEKEGKKKGKGFTEDAEGDIGGGLLVVIGYEIGQNDDDRSLITVFHVHDS